MKLATSFCLIALRSVLTGCDPYSQSPPPPTLPGGAAMATTRCEFDIREMKTDFTKLDVAILHKGKRLGSGKVEGERLVLAFSRNSFIPEKELILEISRDGKTLLKKEWGSVNNVDIRSLDLKLP